MLPETFGYTIITHMTDYNPNIYFEHTPGSTTWNFNEESMFVDTSTYLYWHTPGIMDGGIFLSCHFDIDKSALNIYTRHDGFIEGDYIDRCTILLERYRFSNVTVSVDADSGWISYTMTHNPLRRTYIVQYFDYNVNAEVAVRVEANSEREAKIVAWYHSCYRDHNINAFPFRAVEESRPLTRGQSSINDDVFNTQLAILDAIQDK